MDNTDTCTRIAEPNQIIRPMKFPALFGVKRLAEIPVKRENKRVFSGILFLSLSKMERHLSPSKAQLSGMSSKVSNKPRGLDKMSWSSWLDVALLS
jgi:hypothetical protein